MHAHDDPAHAATPAKPNGPAAPAHQERGLAHLQRVIGNRSVSHLLVQRAEQGTVESPVDKALRTKDPGDAKAISDFSGIPIDKKVALIRILAYQGWVGPFDERQIFNLWNSLSEADLIRTASQEIVLWNWCIEVGADLEQVPNAKGLRAAFWADVVEVARGYLNSNRQLVLNEMTQAGLPQAEGQTIPPPTEQQAKQLAAMQEAAAQVADIQAEQERARTVPAGYEIKMWGDQGMWGFPIPFDPNRPPPQLDEAAVKAAGGRGVRGPVFDYVGLRLMYQQASDSVSALVGMFPMLYAVSREGKSSVTGEFAAERDPASARARLATALRKLIADIENADKKLGRELNPLDLLPIHQHLYSGLRSASKVDWSQAFPTFMAKKYAEERDFGQALAALGLQKVSDAAFMLAPFTSGASLVALLAVGVGAAGTKAYIAGEQYDTLMQASKVAVAKGTELVSEQQVDEAKVLAQAAQAELALAAFNAVAIGAGALSRWRAARAGTEAKPGMAEKAMDFIDDATAFDAWVDAMPEASAAMEKIVLAPAAPAQRTAQRTVQRAGEEVLGTHAKQFERYADAQLWAGNVEGIPKMNFIIPGVHNRSDNGIDRIGLVIKDGQVEVWYLEMKWREIPEKDAPRPTVELKSKGQFGTQMGGKWTENAVNHLCDSSHPSAVAARDALRMQLARSRNVPLSAVSHDEVKTFLRANVKANKAVIVPWHADHVKRLLKQIAALIRHGNKIKVGRVKLPQ
ncbi:hypothetical protein ACQEVF_23935 [Nonomuraea polychroma]|uniref:hypothetical protein n=1 Tax=Nonomuraea polychroma TaxID=46176 RepID=UPI003D8DD248